MAYGHMIEVYTQYNFFFAYYDSVQYIFISNFTGKTLFLSNSIIIIRFARLCDLVQENVTFLVFISLFYVLILCMLNYTRGIQ